LIAPFSNTAYTMGIIYTTYGSYSTSTTQTDTRCIKTLADFDTQLNTLSFDYTTGSGSLNTITNFATLIFDYTSVDTRVTNFETCTAVGVFGSVGTNPMAGETYYTQLVEVNPTLPTAVVDYANVQSDFNTYFTDHADWFVKWTADQLWTSSANSFKITRADAANSLDIPLT
jgi:hypothetical protein